jgi:hypothetical protein
MSKNLRHHLQYSQYQQSLQDAHLRLHHHFHLLLVFLEKYLYHHHLQLLLQVILLYNLLHQLLLQVRHLELLKH